MNASDPMEEPCGALTRAHTRCRRRPCKGRKRCHLHGGKSLRGVDHPRFKHGRYSKDDPLGEKAKADYAKWLRAVERDYWREMRKLPGFNAVTAIGAMRWHNRAMAVYRRVLARHPRPTSREPPPLFVTLRRARLEIKRGEWTRSGEVEETG